MSAVTLTLTAEAAADIAALFIVADDTLAERVARIGALGGMDAKAEGGASGARIFAAIDAHYAGGTRPVGLSAASVDNALGAYRMAHRILSAEAARAAYADVLTAVHAARVTPLEEAWTAAIVAANVPKGKRGDAKRRALLADALKAVADAKDAAKAAARATREAAAAEAAKVAAAAEAEAARVAALSAEEAEAEAAADAAEAEAEADVSPEAVADRAAARILATLADVLAGVAILTAADAARVAEAAAAIVAAASERAAAEAVAA